MSWGPVRAPTSRSARGRRRWAGLGGPYFLDEPTEASCDALLWAGLVLLTSPSSGSGWAGRASSDVLALRVVRRRSPCRRSCGAVLAGRCTSASDPTARRRASFGAVVGARARGLGGRGRDRIAPARRLATPLTGSDPRESRPAPAVARSGLGPVLRPGRGDAVELTEADAVRRVAMISVHTSPLDQPGTGDAGGMNVYVIELSRRLAAARHRGRHLHPRDLVRARADASTRATASPCAHPRRPVRGPDQGRAARPALRLRPRGAARRGRACRSATTTWSTPTTGSPARSARSPATAGACRWCTPCTRWPRSRTRRSPSATPRSRSARIIGEEQVVEAADMLIANTDLEAKQLINLYDADPGRVEVVHPGVDLDVFRPQDRTAARDAARASRRTRSCCCSPAGSSRSRPPTCCCAPSPCCSTASPTCASRLVVPIVGGPSGTGLEHPEALADARRRARHRRRGALRAAGRPGRAGRLVRRCHRWSRCRRTTSRSAWSPSRRRPAGRRSSPPRSAASPRWSRDGRSGLLRRQPRARRLGRRDRPGPRRRRRCAPAWPRVRSSTRRAFSWEATAEQTLDVYERPLAR